MANLLDWLVSTVSPARAERRELARLRQSGIARARMVYEGATAGRRSQGWRTVATDANTEIQGAGSRLRDVARDMVRNNPYAARAKAVITHNVVGPGIIPTVQGGTKTARKQLEDLLKAHFDTVACDTLARHDLYGLQNLAMGIIVEAGEVLVRKRPRYAEDRLPIAWQLQVMEPDYLDSTVNGPLSNGNNAVQGVEFDAVGRIVAYYLFDKHPGAASSFSRPTSTRVPAEMVAHVFRSDREQARGVSWFAPVILRMRDFADFTDAQLMRQKVAACFAAFITGEDDNIEGISAATGDDIYPTESMEPGMITRLRSGESVEFGSPPGVGDFGPYATATLREIAAGLGISYEAFTGDLSGVNFSAGRMGWLEFQRSIDSWRNHMLMPQLLYRIGGWFLDGARANGYRTEGASIMWTAPRREMISPSDEVPAAISAIRAGLTSRSEQVRKLGFDPADLDREIADDNKRADALGLILDSDPRQTTQNGGPAKPAKPADNPADTPAPGAA